MSALGPSAIAREGLDDNHAATAAWAWVWQSAGLIGFGGGIDIRLRCALRHGELADGRRLWEAVMEREALQPAAPITLPRYGEPTLIRPRLGQGAFRVTVTDVYLFRTVCFADDSEEAEQRSLETCGARWDSKLKAYREELAQAKGYRTYFETWKDSPAQRPPLLPLPVLTRTSYRQCMAQCLEAAGAICPGGWPDEK